MNNPVVPSISQAITSPGWLTSLSWYKFFENVARKLNFQTDGWTASTGTAYKGAYASYAGQVVSNPPTQAQVQALDNAVVQLSQRLVALEDSIRAAGIIN